MDEAALRELPKINARTPYLAMTANFAVMAGLLGTISGMIKSFGSVGSDEGGNKATELANGIAEALNCTAFGIGTSLIGLLGFSLLQGKTTRGDRRHQRGDRAGRQPRDVAPRADAAARRNPSSQPSTSSEEDPPMGASVGTGDKKSVNVELNIVPFIDLMSCLTAFLLVTAVWVNIAQINIQPKGKTRDTTQRPAGRRARDALGARASRPHLGRAVAHQRVPGDPEEGRSTGLGASSRTRSRSTRPRRSLRIARTSRSRPSRRHSRRSKYQDIIHAMDVAVKVGFVDVGLSDPDGLAARPSCKGG